MRRFAIWLLVCSLALVARAQPPSVEFPAGGGDHLAFSGTGDPNTTGCAGNPCDCQNVNKDRYINTSNGQAWYCTSSTSNTWAQFAGATSGYSTVQEDGAPLTQRSTIDFQAGLTAADSGGKTIVNGAQFQEEGSSTGIPIRTTINFVGNGATVTDEGGKTKVSIPGGSPTGYQTIEDEGAAETQRTTINFVGGGVSVSDVGGETEVEIPTGSAIANSFLNTGELVSVYPAAPSNTGLRVIGASISDSLDLSRMTPVLPEPGGSASQYANHIFTTYSRAAINSVNLMNYAYLQPANAACPSQVAGNYPECPIAKTNVSPYQFWHYKEGLSQQGSGFAWVNNCLGPGDCMGMSLFQRAYAGAPAGGDEGSTMLRIAHDDTWPAQPMSRSMTTAVDTLTGAQASVVWNATGNDAFEKFAKDAWVVWENDPLDGSGDDLGNCEDTGGAAGVDAPCRMVLDGSAGAAGVLSVGNDGIWTVAQSTDLGGGTNPHVRYNSTVGHTGYCFSLDAAQHQTANGSLHRWWLPILYGPGDSVNPYVAGGAASAAFSFNAQSDVDAGDANCPGTGDCITVPGHTFGSTGTVAHTTWAGTLPSYVSGGSNVPLGPTANPSNLGHWIRVLDASDRIAVYASKAAAEADTGGRYDLVDGSNATGTVGTGHSCWNPAGCAANQFHTFYAEPNLSSQGGKFSGFPGENYVPGKKTSEALTGAAGDDGLVVACERVARIEEIDLDPVDGRPRDATARIFFEPTAKPERLIPAGADSQIGYPAAAQWSTGIYYLDTMTRRPSSTGGATVFDIGGLDNHSPTMGTVVSVISHAAVNKGRTVAIPFYVLGAIGDDARGSEPSNYDQHALLFHQNALMAAADYVQDKQAAYMVQMPYAEWATTDSDEMPLARYLAGFTAEGVELQYDSLDGLWRSKRGAKECAVSSGRPGKICKVDADCGTGTCGGTVTTPMQLLQARYSTTSGPPQWAVGVTCNVACENVGLTCFNGLDMTVAPPQTPGCDTSRSGQGMICQCRGNQ